MPLLFMPRTVSSLFILAANCTSNAHVGAIRVYALREDGWLPSAGVSLPFQYELRNCAV